ncbi:MAG: InlB B-repeat-containing protein [Clostridiales Family XIII bacterium]|jgi:uncharacterized repeat protein (TIGR02543 family)|nr:InlB B-repeat-containing protein [Clostridiales Family XIII bacterium]
MEGNNNPIQENNDWIAGQARNDNTDGDDVDADGDNDADADFSVQPPRQSLTDTPPQEGNGDVELWALGLGDISALAAAPTATVGGVDLGSSNDTYTTDVETAYRLPIDVTVQSHFDSSATSRQIIIRLKPGIGLDSAPGMKGGNKYTNNWEWDESIIDDKSPFYNKFESAAFVSSDPIELGTGVNYQPIAGTLTYDLNDGIVGLPLELKLIADKAYIASPEELTLDDLVTIEVKQDGSRVGDPLVLEHYTIEEEYSTEASLLAVPTSMGAVVSAGQGQSIAIPVHSLLSVLPVGGSRIYYESNDPVALKSLTLSMTVPKELNVTGISFDGLGSLLESALIDYDVTSHDATNNLLTINFGAALTKGAQNTRAFKIVGTLANDAEMKRYEITPVSGEAIGPVGQMIKQYRMAQYVYFDVLSTATNFTFSDFPNSSISALEVASPAAQIPLGGINMSNATINTLDGRRLHIDFDSGETGNIGVTAVRLVAGPSGATGIVIKTTGGRTLNDPDVVPSIVPINTITYNGATWADVAPDLNTGEYISSIEYNLGAIAPGVTTSTAYGLQAGAFQLSTTGNQALCSAMYYFGKLLGTTQYQSTAKVLTSDGEGGWTENATETKTQITTVNSSSSINDIQYSINTWNGGSLVGGGVSRLYTATFGLESLCNKTFNDINAIKGLTFYVREPESLLIDPTKITVSYEGVDYYPDFDDTFEDESGATVYAIKMPEAVIGYYKENVQGYSTIQVVANDVKARPTALSGTVPMQDIFMATLDDYTVNPENYNFRSTSGGSYNFRFDEFGLIGDPGELTLASPIASEGISVQAARDLVVGTKADKGDGVWASYNPSNPASIISLNTQLDARYQVEVINNSGLKAENGYTALIPIPKKDENTENNKIQSEDFTWSLYLEEPLVLGTGYAVKYAENYELNDDEGAVSSWKDWGEIANTDNIRMIKVVYDGELEDGESDEFHFNIGTPSDEEEASEARNKVNTYSSYVYKDISGFEGWAASAPVALKLATGIVKGKVTTDKNHDGNFDGEDDNAGGIQVNAYKTGTNNIVDNTRTKSDGTYTLYNLDSLEAVDIEFVNPGTTTNPQRYVKPTAPTNSTNNANLKIVNIMPSGTGSDSVNALLQHPYTVTFETNGGVPIPDAQKVFTGEYANAPADAPKAGHNFGGWYSDEEFDSTWSASTPVTSNLTIYAKQNAKAVTISYDENGGLTFTPSGEQTSRPYGSTVASLPITGKIWQLYDWYVVGTEIKWVAGTTELITANGVVGAGESDPTLALEARYRANNTYTVTYNQGIAPNGTITGAAPDTKVGQTSTSTGYDVSEGELALTGYKLKEWNTLADGNGVSVGANTTYSDLAVVDKPSVDLYAIWEEDSVYKVTYNSASGSSVADKNFVKWSDTELLPSDPSRSGYDFDGWTAAKTGNARLDDDTKYSDIAANTSAMSVELSAHWTLKNYTISYSGITSADNKDNPAQYTIEATPVSIANPTKDHYNFLGWRSTALGLDGTAKGISIPEGNTEAVDLEATWEAVAYTIDYVGIEGADNGSNPTGYNIEGTPISIADAQKRGYMFDGWTATGGYVQGTNTKSLQIPAETSGNITLEAHFTVIPYTIGYDLNDGEFAVSDTHPEDYDVTSGAINVSNPTKVGYKFEGWTVANDEVGDGEFKVDATAKDISVPASSIGNLSFIAHFSLKDYEIEYDMTAGGTNPNASLKKYTVEDSFPIAIADASGRDGYVFTGWTATGGFEQAVATKGLEIPDTVKAAPSKIVLTPHWAGILTVSASNVSVSFDGNAHGLSGVVAKVASSAAPSDTVISYSDSKNGTYSATAPTFKDAGTYTVYVKATHADTANYVNSAVISKTVTISKRAITVKPVDAEKVYDGSELTHADVELVSGTLVNGHNIDVSKATFTGSLTEVGTATGTVSGVEISGGNTGNYDIAYGEGTLTVTAPDNGVDNGGGDGTGGQNDGNDDENGNNEDDDDTVVDEPKEPKAPAVKDKTEVAFTPTKNYTPRQQAMIEKNPQIEAFIEKSVPVASIGNTDVPLYGLAGVDSWALSNALLAGFSLIIAAIALLNATVRRKALGGVDKDRGGIRFPLIVAAFALAIVNMALFFTIEDTSAIMTLIDGWSVASVALTGGVVFLSKLAFRRPVAAE